MGNGLEVKGTYFLKNVNLQIKAQGTMQVIFNVLLRITFAVRDPEIILTFRVLDRTSQPQCEWSRGSVASL